MALYARQWLDRAAAEDVVQDVFLRRASDVPRVENVKAWLFRAVRNAAVSHRRSSIRRARREQALAGERGECFEAGPGDLIDAAAAERVLRSLRAINTRSSCGASGAGCRWRSARR
jgi:DNA-directed RNA polymerase specialized sigma24 family protein